MDKELKRRGIEALKQGDLGEEVDDGLFIKELGTVTRKPEPEKGEVVEAEPAKTLHRKPLYQREELVGEIAARVMDDYINSLNDLTKPNPIRDGIPVCAVHTFPPGCVMKCKTGVSRKTDHTLGDVFTWVKALAAHHYQRLLTRRPELKGWKQAA